jgi:opine dehydrogenase
VKVAILGTGGIGRGTAAFLAAAGLTPVLWSPTGVVATTQTIEVTASYAEAVARAEIVIVAVVGNGLRATLRSCSFAAEGSLAQAARRTL